MDYYLLQKTSLQLIRLTAREFEILNEEDYDLDGDILIEYDKKSCRVNSSEDISKYWFHDFTFALEECVQDNENKAREFIDYISDYGDNPSALWLYCGTVTGGEKYRLDDYLERQQF